MRIIVRGGVYEVDLAEWKCHSLYWPGEAFDIMRGTWWVPMRGQWRIFVLSVCLIESMESWRDLEAREKCQHMILMSLILNTRSFVPLRLQ